jgi:peptidoglycan-associated lipoprotein
VAPAAKSASHLDPKSSIATQRTIFFDFDDYSIKPEFENLVNEHGQYLLAHPELAVRVEGHADERGSSEYNLALGQKRAVAVSRALTQFGVKASQIATISFASEKPVARGHDESVWAQNRRVEMKYPSR